jgi:hypothetical protein
LPIIQIIENHDEAKQKLLLQAGASISWKMGRDTLLTWLIKKEPRNNNYPLISLLVEAMQEQNIDISLPNKFGEKATELVVASGDSKLIDIFRAHGLIEQSVLSY